MLNLTSNFQCVEEHFLAGFMSCLQGKIPLIWIDIADHKECSTIHCISQIYKRIRTLCLKFHISFFL